MIASLSVCLALLAPSNSEQWGATTTTAATLARQVDTKLATLTKAKLSYRFSLYKREAGAAGHADCTGTIFTPSRFALQVPTVTLTKPEWLVRERWVADGGRYGHAPEDDALPSRPLSQRPAGPASPIDAWFTNFSQVILAGVGRPSRPFEGLVADAKAKRYGTVVQRRQFTFGGKPYTQYRMVFNKGAARYEINFDAHFLLPTGVINFIGTVDNSRWSAVRWDFPRKPLDPSVLTFKGPKVITPSSRPPRR